nr:MAG TPA: hypothetical protein [Caudoviricetes sp.]
MTWLTRLTHSVDANFTFYRYYITMSTMSTKYYYKI